MDNVSWLMNMLLCSLQISFEVGLPTSWLDHESKNHDWLDSMMQTLYIYIYI